MYIKFSSSYAVPIWSAIWLESLGIFELTYLVNQKTPKQRKVQKSQPANKPFHNTKRIKGKSTPFNTIKNPQKTGTFGHSIEGAVYLYRPPLLEWITPGLLQKVLRLLPHQRTIRLLLPSNIDSQLTLQCNGHLLPLRRTTTERSKPAAMRVNTLWKPHLFCTKSKNTSNIFIMKVLKIHSDVGGK